MGKGSLKWSEEDLADYRARVANGMAPPALELNRMPLARTVFAGSDLLVEILDADDQRAKPMLVPAGQGTQAAVTFTVGGTPVGKARARVFKDSKTGAMRAANPKKTAQFSKIVALHAKRAMRYRAMLTGPLEIELLCYMPIPASWSKKKKADAIACNIRPTSKPDWDNVGKAISDACNKIVYEDDSQIVDAIVRKYYAERPRVQVIIGGVAPHGRDF